MKTRLWTKIRIIILGTTAGIVAILVGLPKSWLNSFEPEQIYPVDLPLNTSGSPVWQFLSSEAVNPNDNWTGYRYLYQVNLNGQQTTLNAEVFLRGPDPTVPIQTQDVFSTLIFDSDRELPLPSPRIRYESETGYFGEFIDQNRVYLSACILPEGGSIFDQSQHQFSRQILMQSPQHILLWIIGRRDLRNWQCLWTNLSLPVQEVTSKVQINTDQLTLNDLLEIREETEKSFVVLRDFWHIWYDYWSDKL